MHSIHKLSYPPFKRTSLIREALFVHGFIHAAPSAVWCPAPREQRYKRTQSILLVYLLKEKVPYRPPLPQNATTPHIRVFAQTAVDIFVGENPGQSLRTYHDPYPTHPYFLVCNREGLLLSSLSLPYILAWLRQPASQPASHILLLQYSHSGKIWPNQPLPCFYIDNSQVNSIFEFNNTLRHTIRSQPTKNKVGTVLARAFFFSPITHKQQKQHPNGTRRSSPPCYCWT